MLGLVGLCKACCHSRVGGNDGSGPPPFTSGLRIKSAMTDLSAMMFYCSKKLSANCCVYSAIFGIVDCVEYRYMYEDGFSGFMQLMR